MAEKAAVDFPWWSLLAAVLAAVIAWLRGSLEAKNWVER